MPPAASHVTVGDDIERIRENRNKLSHNTDFKMNDADFTKFWTDLAQVISLSLVRVKKDRFLSYLLQTYL